MHGSIWKVDPQSGEAWELTSGNKLHSSPAWSPDGKWIVYTADDDWKSIIRNGRGIWLYRPCSDGTLFKTVYDYDVRHGWIGRVLDAAIFRSLLQLATEWGFETLRQWCAGDDLATTRRRGRLPFLWFYLKRRCGVQPAIGAARSWLGTGNVAETLYEREVFAGAAAAASGRAT